MKTYKFLIAACMVFAFTSCNPEDEELQGVYLTVPTIINNIQMDIGDYKQYLIEEEEDILFQVTINGEKFVADEVRTIKQDSMISIVGKNLFLDRTVFLSFRLEEESTLLLGKSKDNPQNNVAGYLLNSENKGYVTSEIYNTCGSITIENLDDVNSTVSGKFNFSACDRGDHILELTDGVFKNIIF